MLCRTQLLFKLLDIYGAYPPNTYKFDPQKYLAGFGRSAKHLDFPIFFQNCFSRNFCGIAFFSGKLFFEQNFRYPKRIKTSCKIFGEQHNIKQLSHKFFLSVHTKGTKKFNFFDFSCFLAGIMGNIAY